MTDLILEIMRAVVTALLLLYLWLEGRKAGFRKEKGWPLILAGFGLVLFGTFVDISDNFPSLNRFVIIGDTPIEAFLEKVVGYLGGFLLLAAGFRLWIPAIASRSAAENDIRESEEKFRAAFETNPDVAVITRLEDGIIVEANRGLFAVTGYSPEEVIGRLSGGFLWSDPQVRERFIQGLESKGRVENIETSFVMKDGNRKWGLVSASTFSYGGVPHFLTVGKDITSLKAVEEALRRSEENYREVFDSTSDAIFIHDQETGKILDVNRTMCEMYGFSLEEAKLLSIRDLSSGEPPSSEAEGAAWIRKAVEEGPQVFEWHARRKDGSLFWAEVALKLTSIGGEGRVLAAVRDITDRKRIEKELRDALSRADMERARAESVIAAIGDSIIVQDRDYRITYQNEVNRRLFGDRRGELCHKVYEGLDTICPECPVEITFRDGLVHRTLRRNVPIGDRTLHFELVSSPLLDGEGNVVAGLKLVRDITDRIRAEEDLEQQNVELRKLDEIKDGLIRDVSHELKTPVAKQAMHLEMLKAQLGDHCTEKAGKILEVMEDCVRRQESVIRNLLSVSRLQGGHVDFPLSPVRLDRVVEKVIDDYSLVLQEKGVDLEAKVEPVTIRGSEEMLWHVFANLLGNAFKFRSREGGARVEVSLVCRGGSVTAVVADNGIGLRREFLPSVFERFFQVSASVEGSGIGLSICREMVTKMGGTISFDSHGEDHGASVTVTFPLIEDVT